VLDGTKEMAKKPRFFTVIVVPSFHGKVRRITVPRFLISIAIIILVVGFFGLFYFVSEYKIIKEKLAYYRNLEKLAQIQQEKIVSLNKRVAQFSETLNKLKEVENRLKTIVGGGVSRSVEESFGEGGPQGYVLFDSFAPEEITTNSLETISKIEEKLEALKSEVELRRKKLTEIQEIIKDKKELFASTPNIFPVKGWISSGYGIRINPFTGRKEMHEAIDIVAPWGAPVRAACQGKVVYSGWRDLYGLVIEVKNKYGYSAVYAHLSKILVKEGQEVKKGEIIGRVGSSGRSTGPHLHFEVWKGRKTVDPLKLMVEPLDLG